MIFFNDRRAIDRRFRLPRAAGIKSVMYGKNGGFMQRKQLWTKISGGLMSLFVLVNIISCSNIYHDDTGTVTSGWVSKKSGTTEDLRGIACKGNT